MNLVIWEEGTYTVNKKGGDSMEMIQDILLLFVQEAKKLMGKDFRKLLAGMYDSKTPAVKVFGKETILRIRLFY